jgi:predicted RNA binding protein YcfA (HicA-like mRNA interferase family)
MHRSELRRRIAARVNSVRFTELEKMLNAYGWHVERTAKDGHVFFARGPGERLSVPYRRPHLLATYVRQALRLTEGEDDD